MVLSGGRGGGGILKRKLWLYSLGGATALSGATTVSVLRQPSVAACRPTPYIHLGILKVKEVMEGPPAKASYAL